MFAPVPPSPEGGSVTHTTPPESPTTSTHNEFFIKIDSVGLEEGSDPPTYWFGGGLDLRQQADDCEDMAGMITNHLRCLSDKIIGCPQPY